MRFRNKCGNLEYYATSYRADRHYKTFVGVFLGEGLNQSDYWLAILCLEQSLVRHGIRQNLTNDENQVSVNKGYWTVRMSVLGF